MPVVVLSLYALGHLGLGTFLLRPLLGKRTFEKLTPPFTWFSSMLLGLTLGQIVILCGLPIKVWAWFLVGVGTVTIFICIVHYRTLRTIHFSWKLFFLLAVFPLSKMAWEPIASWDPYFHWFFQAKMLYYDGTFEAGTWLNPAIEFSHPAYPKFIQILASQTGFLVGYWNSYWPKLSIALLFVTVLWGYLALPMKGILRLPLGVLLLSASGYYLWTGYLDSYLGLFLFLGLIYLFYAREHRRQEFYLVGFLSLSVVMSLKNEGILLGAIVLAITIIDHWLKRDHKAFFSSKNWGILFFSLLPIALWWGLRSVWGLENDMQGSYVLSENFSENIGPYRLWTRLTQEGYPYVFLKFYILKTDLKVALPLVLLVGLWVWFFRIQPEWRGLGYVFCAFAGYSVVLFCYYLCTYHYTPEQQLASSINRVAIPLSYMVIAMIHFLVSPKMEVASEPSAVLRNYPSKAHY